MGGPHAEWRPINVVKQCCEGSLLQDERKKREIFFLAIFRRYYGPSRRTIIRYDKYVPVAGRAQEHHDTHQEPWRSTRARVQACVHVCV